MSSNAARASSANERIQQERGRQKVRHTHPEHASRSRSRPRPVLHKGGKGKAKDGKGKAKDGKDRGKRKTTSVPTEGKGNTTVDNNDILSTDTKHFHDRILQCVPIRYREKGEWNKQIFQRVQIDLDDNLEKRADFLENIRTRQGPRQDNEQEDLHRSWS